MSAVTTERRSVVAFIQVSVAFDGEPMTINTDHIFTKPAYDGGTELAMSGNGGGLVGLTRGRTSRFLGK